MAASGVPRGEGPVPEHAIYVIVLSKVCQNHPTIELNYQKAAISVLKLLHTLLGFVNEVVPKSGYANLVEIFI